MVKKKKSADVQTELLQFYGRRNKISLKILFSAKKKEHADKMFVTKGVSSFRGSSSVLHFVTYLSDVLIDNRCGSSQAKDSELRRDDRCLEHINLGMCHNSLQLNRNQTDAVVFGPNEEQSRVNTASASARN